MPLSTSSLLGLSRCWHRWRCAKINPLYKKAPRRLVLSLQSAFLHLYSVCPGAPSVSRTRDQRFRKPLLYPLSYGSLSFPRLLTLVVMRHTIAQIRKIVNPSRLKGNRSGQAVHLALSGCDPTRWRSRCVALSDCNTNSTTSAISFLVA